MKEAKIGKNQNMYLLDPLDVWIPGASGSSARVFRGSMLNHNGLKKMKAIKIMRPDKLDYALPLFMEEILILQDMKDVRGVVSMNEYGLMHVDGKKDLLIEDKPDNAKSLTGEYLSFGAEERFDEMLFKKETENGWLPYIALDLKGDSNNLLRHCNPQMTNGRYLHVKDGVRIAIQVCELLAIAHSKNIVYLDHKILHYYWDGDFISMIDWNVGRRHVEGLSDHDKGFDLVQFGARMLFFAFTGRQPKGALSLGPTRPEEIQASPHSYVANWEYDDKRLPDVLKQLLQAIMSGEYFDVKKLLDDFKVVFEKLA